MSKYEERAFQVGKSKPDLAALKNQLGRLKDDLDRFMSRKPDGTVVAPLRARIRELESQIATAENERRQERQRAAESGDDAADPTARPRMASGAGRFPPRRRP